MVIVGSDSHTPHSGCLGAVAFGVGTSAIVNSWATRDVRIEVPRSVRIRAAGRLPENVTAKDLMLEILRHPYVKGGDAIGKVIEYGGEAIEAMGIDERATLTNMAAEIGAFTGICEADEKTADFLVERRGMDRAEAERLCDRVAIIDEGKIKAQGTRRELVSLVGHKDRVSIVGGGDLAAAAEAVAALDGVSDVSTADHRLEILADEASVLLPDILVRVSGAGASISEVVVVEPNLEAVFLHLTGKALRD
jgi:hypothetical protein